MEQRYVHTSISLVPAVMKLYKFCKVFQFLVKSFMNHGDIHGLQKSDFLTYIFWETLPQVISWIRVTKIHNKFLQALPKLLHTTSRLLIWHKFPFTQIFFLKLLLPLRNIHNFYLFCSLKRLYRDSFINFLLPKTNIWQNVLANMRTWWKLCHVLLLQSSPVHVRYFREKKTIRHMVSCVPDAEPSPAWWTTFFLLLSNATLMPARPEGEQVTV